MRKNIYYMAGVACLLLSAVLIASTHFSSGRADETSSYRQVDRGYENFYHIAFPIPKNSLRQGTVYLPIYSNREEDCAMQLLSAFSVEDSHATEEREYFEIRDHQKILRIYKYIDLLEFENLPASVGQDRFQGEPVCDDAALTLAQDFLDAFLPHRKPYDTKITRHGHEIVVEFTSHLANLPSRAFPTQITLDSHGNVLRANHFFFDYEVLDSTDIIPVKSALAKLPQDHSEKIRLTGYTLIYDLVDSVLMPVYRFEGQKTCGTPFIYQVTALKFY